MSVSKIPTIKLWHDDIRRAPEGWVWARTNEEAKRVLEEGNVVEISMDHDLGLHELDPDDYNTPYALIGQSSETGLDLVNWMCQTRNVPEYITIHSWNPDGAKSMAARLNYFGWNCWIKPFDPNRKVY